jgi:hypothetical protein
MSTDIVTRRRAVRPRSRGSIPIRSKRIFFLSSDHNGFGIRLDFYSAGKREIFQGQKRPGSQAGISPALSDSAKYA